MAREPFKNTVAGIIILGVISSVIANQFGVINIRSWFVRASSGNTSSVQSEKNSDGTEPRKAPEYHPTPVQRQSVRPETPTPQPTPIADLIQRKVPGENVAVEQDPVLPPASVTKSEPTATTQNAVQQTDAPSATTDLPPLQCSIPDPFEAYHRNYALAIHLPEGVEYVSGTGNIYTAKEKDGHWQATSKWIAELIAADEDREVTAHDLPVGTFMAQWVISHGLRHADCAAVIIVDKSGRIFWKPIK